MRQDFDDCLVSWYAKCLRLGRARLACVEIEVVDFAHREYSVVTITPLAMNKLFKV